MFDKMVHELLTAIDRHAKTLGYKYNLPFDLYFTTMIYLDKKGELTTEDVEHVFSNEEMRSIFSRFMHLPTIISVVTLIKKYNESVSDVLMTRMGFQLSGTNMLKEFIDVVDLLKFDTPNDRHFFNKLRPAYTGIDPSDSRFIVHDHFVAVNLAQDILVRGNSEMYEIVKTRYVYTKDDIVYTVYTAVDNPNFFKKFVADQAITGSDMICYSNIGQKISIYQKIVEICGQEFVNTHFAHLAPRPTYPIVKMIPDVGRVSLLDETHATVQTLTATGLVEKQMTYTITDGKIRLVTEPAVVEASW